jgi:hydroxymethylpyrimidine/phosphomethylpyrimidine kinase
MRVALTIAGSDSSAGAGIQADLKTFAAFGVYGATAITAVTVQSTRGVEAVTPLSSDLVTAQIEAVAGDLTIAATKIGMLATAAIVEAVAAVIKELALPLVVLDPVLVSTSGERLLDADGVQAMCLELMPQARVITPNIPEAEALSGRRISSLAEALEAARRIHDMGPAAVIITGGHGPGTKDGPVTKDRGPGIEIVDVLFDDGQFHEFRTPRIDSTHTHGTGCTFASAIAASLALGHSVPEAAARAQQYVAGAIAHAPGIGHGRGPLNHFWEWNSRP